MRIQVKMAWLSRDRGAIVFNTLAGQKRVDGKWKRADYAGKADWFAVYSPDTGKVYLISVAEASKGQMTLRLYPTENGQEWGVKWAKDYEI